jgi:hypothetical protein
MTRVKLGRSCEGLLTIELYVTKWHQRLSNSNFNPTLYRGSLGGGRRTSLQPRVHVHTYEYPNANM